MSEHDSLLEQYRSAILKHERWCSAFSRRTDREKTASDVDEKAALQALQAHVAELVRDRDRAEKSLNKILKEGANGLQG